MGLSNKLKLNIWIIRMSAFVIADITVNDLEHYENYKKLAPPAIAAYGGKYMARGGKAEKLEGYRITTKLS